MYQHCWDETFPVSEPRRDIFHPLASFDRKPSGLISNTHTHADDKGHKQKMLKSLLSTAVPDQLLASRAPAPDAAERLDGRRLGLVGKQNHGVALTISQLKRIEIIGSYKNKLVLSLYLVLFWLIASGSPLPLRSSAFLIPRKQLGYSLQSSHWEDGHLYKEKIAACIAAVLD